MSSKRVPIKKFRPDQEYPNFRSEVLEKGNTARRNQAQYQRRRDGYAGIVCPSCTVCGSSNTVMEGMPPDPCYFRCNSCGQYYRACGAKMRGLDKRCARRPRHDGNRCPLHCGRNGVKKVIYHESEIFWDMSNLTKDQEKQIQERVNNPRLLEGKRTAAMVDIVVEGLYREVQEGKFIDSKELADEIRGCRAAFNLLYDYVLKHEDFTQQDFEKTWNVADVKLRNIYNMIREDQRKTGAINMLLTGIRTSTSVKKTEIDREIKARDHIDLSTLLGMITSIVDAVNGAIEKGTDPNEAMYRVLQEMGLAGVLEGDNGSKHQNKQLPNPSD